MDKPKDPITVGERPTFAEPPWRSEGVRPPYHRFWRCRCDICWYMDTIVVAALLCLGALVLRPVLDAIMGG